MLHSKTHRNWSALVAALDMGSRSDEVAGEQWVILVPDRWNKQVQMAWRYYPCELALPGRAQQPPRAPRVSACETRMRVIICYLGLGRSLAPVHVGHAIQQYCALFAWYVLSEHALTFRKPRKYFHQIRVHRGVNSPTG